MKSVYFVVTDNLKTANIQNEYILQDDHCIVLRFSELVHKKCVV